MFTLIAIGTGTAYLFSVVAVAGAAHFPCAFRGADGTMPVYFEAAAAITALVLLGQVSRACAPAASTSTAIRALLKLVAENRAARPLATARRSTSRSSMCSPAIRLRVRPGEKVPVDGVVLDGESAVDESLCHGRADPCGKNAGAASRAAPSTAPAHSSCAPNASAAKPCSRKSCAWSARRSAAARPSSSLPTASRATLCPLSCHRGRNVSFVGAVRTRAAHGPRAWSTQSPC